MNTRNNEGPNSVQQVLVHVNEDIRIFNTDERDTKVDTCFCAARGLRISSAIVEELDAIEIKDGFVF